MAPATITGIRTFDARYALAPGEGTDAVHTDPVYSYPVTILETDANIRGIGIALTLGGGNDLICRLIEALSQELVGVEIEQLMADFGAVSRRIADNPQYRWLGPHKGMVHLALASITNACFDLWAKSRGVPLWRLLLDLSPEEIAALLDLSYLEDELTADMAISLIEKERATRDQRSGLIERGYRGYDTSIGWAAYSDEQVQQNVRQAAEAGFNAFKLKVGSRDSERDVRRAFMVRETAGEDARIMLDCNQQWTLPQAIDLCRRLAPMRPYWIEEPTHPDDVLAHKMLARAIDPLKIALGEHVPHRVLFKNFLQAKAVDFVQVDCTRVGGVSEFITVSLLARKFGVPVVPHVGDMGQIHQHLVLFNHIALGHEEIFLEYIPHLRERFVQPAHVSDGVYYTPQEPGSSSDLKGI